jgi:3-isopropylmalate dehydrogenase
MLLDTVADRTGRDAYRKAAARIDAAVRQVTPKLKSLSAGQMGYSTTEVGDLVVEAL